MLPFTCTSRCKRSADANQSKPRSSKLRPIQPKCSRASAVRSGSVSSGKHSSKLRKAMRRRDAASRHSSAPKPWPNAASRARGKKCSNHNKAMTQRAPKRDSIQRSCEELEAGDVAGGAGGFGAAPMSSPRGCL